MAGTPREDGLRATQSAEELRDGIREAQERIHSLYAVYRSYDYDPARYPTGAYVQRTIAARSPCFYFLSTSHGYDKMDWTNDPEQQRTYATAKHLYTEFPLNRVYVADDLESNAALPGTLPMDFFVMATGLWPLTDRPAPQPDGHPYVLKEVAGCPEYSIVRPRLEIVDGHWCHVLERPEIDRLWIDTACGHTLVARETQSTKNGAMIQRIELGGQSEVGHGIWLPTRIRNTQYDYHAVTEEQRKRKVIDALIRVVEIRVNDLTADFFDFRPQPGALLMRPDGGPPIQTHLGGIDLLDDLARWVRDQALRNNAPKPFPVWPTVVSAMVLIALWECGRRIGMSRDRRGAGKATAAM